MLRHRIDSLSPEYVSTPQLLLGSMLGTVLTCLFPTMALFYAFFAALQVRHTDKGRQRGEQQQTKHTEKHSKDRERNGEGGKRVGLITTSGTHEEKA